MSALAGEAATLAHRVVYPALAGSFVVVASVEDAGKGAVNVGGAPFLTAAQ